MSYTHYVGGSNPPGSTLTFYLNLIMGFTEIYGNLRNRSVAIGRGGAFGESMAKSLKRFGMRPEVVGEDPEKLVVLAKSSDSLVVHIPELVHPESEEAVWWANSTHKMATINARIVLLKGDYLSDESATTKIIRNLVAQGCMHINEIEDWEVELPKTLSQLFAKQNSCLGTIL
jgi:hypothetical protein